MLILCVVSKALHVRQKHFLSHKLEREKLESVKSQGFLSASIGAKKKLKVHTVNLKIF